jgi:flagellar biosynthetic protein FliQ
MGVTENTVIAIGQQALYTTLLVAAPMLIVSLVIGLVVSILQATTQIQDQTLSFVPKIVAVLIAGVIFAPWMLNVMVSFTQNLLINIQQFAK